ncbi:MAG: potassium transporter Trk [Candidatus Amoebophilus sp. 36-38]|nr:MAG: potassium transporter Trk [Candidatus Amoebophilus sp. 36-38]
MKKSFIVFGVGRFGLSITQTLMSLGHEVMVVDQEEEKVNRASTIATQALQLDSTDENALKEIGVSNFDEAIVAIGSDILASILTTLLLKSLGVAKVTAKANNDYHSKILQKIGADRIVHPERDMGVRVAHHLVSSNVIDFMELSPELSVVEISTSEKMIGKSLQELEIRKKYGCTVIAIKKQDVQAVNVSPQATDMIQKGDLLVIIGTHEAISLLENSLLVEVKRV